MYAIKKLEEVYIPGQRSISKTVDKESDGIPEQLKCPICFDVPHAEIYQCKNGHIICHVCQASVETCPQCRVPFKIAGDLIRVRALESLLDAVAMPCPYINGGCKGIMARKDVKSHVKNCIYNGKCVQLCKQLGYNCDFWINGLNPNAGLDHFKIQHKTGGPFTVALDGPVEIQVQNIIASPDVVHADGVWTPVMLNVSSDSNQFMILTLLNDEDKSLSWLCLQLNQDEVMSAVQTEVEFLIPSQSGKVPSLKWKVPTISMLDSEEIIKCPGNRMPIQLLKKHYLDKKGELKVQVTLGLMATRRSSAETNGSVVRKLSGICISQVTPRGVTSSKNEEIDMTIKNALVWPKLSC